LWLNVESRKDGIEMKNWKTTLGGIAGILASLGAILGGVATGGYQAAIAGLVALIPSITHLFAKDAAST
jgi:predicted lipid-binding transport protein (Tim44 family)